MMAHDYWKNLVRPGDTLIDATLGNGQDTVFLAQLLKGKGSLIGYDIQLEALENTRKRLEELPDIISETVTLKLKSHTQLEENQIKLIVYNLGYLPGGNKEITTLTESTLLSLQKALARLAPGGAISITCYPGHQEGQREETALKDFLHTLPSSKWCVCYHQWLNRPLAPSLIWLNALPDA